MAYLLRTLLLITACGILLTLTTAMKLLELPFGHIQLAIPTFLFVIFGQAFVMFYFIGSARLIENIHRILHSTNNLKELFETPPSDIAPYQKKVRQYVQDSTLSKRQTIPWTMLTLILGIMAFLFGGAHDTGLVSKVVHVGLVYGFISAMTIGFFKQWTYLGKTHQLLRKVKMLFSIPDSSM